MQIVSNVSLPPPAATEVRARAFRTAIGVWDADLVERLVIRAGVFNADEVRIARELVEEALHRGCDAAGYHFLMADGADGLDGYACYGPIPGTDRRFELYWIAVDPNGRGHGLGHALLDAAQAGAREKGATHLFAETSDRDDYRPAHALYRACGYALHATVPDFHADGDGMMVFGRRL